MEVLIDNQKIMPPSSLDVSKTNIIRSERTASGRMVADIVATKRTITMSWTIIYQAELKKIHDLLENGIFHNITYPDPQGGESTTLTAYLEGDIVAASWGLYGGQRIWKDVKLTLVER